VGAIIYLILKHAPDPGIHPQCSGDILATSHDGDLRIWDQRKGTTPVNYITAHLAKIHGLDWSPNSELQLATSSQDCTVKFWDLSNPKRAEKQLTTGSPVWRARLVK
jgi:WD40 repeat protein